MAHSQRYTHLVIQPLDRDTGGHEVWGSYVTTLKGWGEMDANGVIGEIYPLRDNTRFVWVDHRGYPTEVFDSREELIGFLQSKAPSMEWPEVYRQPGEDA